MTEELEKEAEESFEQYKVTDEDYVVSPYSDDMGEKMLMYNDEYYAEETYLRLYTQGYLAGAEPREKQIQALGERCLQLQKDKGELIDKVRELEKENAELKRHIKADCVDCADYYKNKTLEEENAELKNKLEHRNCLDCSNHSSKLRMKTLELEKECTNAKEIIKDLLSLCEGETDSKLVFTRAEQFINKE